MPMNARERRAAQIAASANKQAELKQEAADRRALRARRDAEERHGVGATTHGEPRVEPRTERS